MRFIYGKNVFITGASSGIGLAAAELLAEADIGIIVHCAGIGISLDGEADPAGAAHGYKLYGCSPR